MNLRGVLLAAVAAASLAAAPVVAQDVSVSIFEHGIYTAEIVRTEKLPSGFNSNIVDRICHVATTELVPARMGLQFGFRYRVDGDPAGAVVELRRVTRFPSLVKPPFNPAQAQSEHTMQLRVGTASYVGYGFDHEWELVRGTWALEIWQRDRKLAEQHFEVGDGEPPAGRVHADENCFQLSASVEPGFKTGGVP